MQLDQCHTGKFSTILNICYSNWKYIACFYHTNRQQNKNFKSCITLLLHMTNFLNPTLNVVLKIYIQTDEHPASVILFVLFDMLTEQNS